jgi:CII-binding regulator of phage lambda lysogenization HflD
MSDAPDGTAIAAIITAGGTAIAAVATAWKGLTDRDALKVRVDALEALGIAALKVTLEQLRTWLESEAPKLRKDLDIVASAVVDMEKRLDRYRDELRGGKRQPTGQQPSLPDLSASVIRDNDQERRLADVERRCEKNSDRIERIAEYVAAINVQLARVETHLLNILESRRQRGTSPV